MSKGETKKRGRTWWVHKLRLIPDEAMKAYTRSLLQDLCFVEVRLVEVRKKKARGK